MENLNNDYTHIKGWGIDADPKNEPTYPMKKYTGDDHKRLNWDRPPLQPVNIEVLHSTERPNITAVFGTSTPPSGLSGAIRRYAFQFSENQYMHWLPLLLADRVNVVEGIVDDLKRGHIPNIFAERGMKAELKHNPKGLAKRILVTVAVTSIAYAILKGKSKKR
ncbi:hypothetical protein GCM10011387_17500 [Pedobacter quisquiliarum]|jgi:hypothetical protein|uniref:Uncharacterized protein n=1 Tax=Pedobacter quisquiliarum TaxID=1834438 RepID=A0A916U9I1_9SPHI|nr:hypothetical protein [Pedobacter quisquiliarum]GGC64377.1 hypothetical protein GCM10011387_17500 [Pedobacter quisquiliarum]